METIFDFNPSNSELTSLIGSLSKEDYLRLTSEEGALQDIAYLLYYRGDKRKAKEYIEKTENTNFINSFWRTVEHP